MDGWTREEKNSEERQMRGKIILSLTTITKLPAINIILSLTSIIHYQATCHYTRGHERTEIDLACLKGFFAFQFGTAFSRSCYS